MEEEALFYPKILCTRCRVHEFGEYLIYRHQFSELIAERTDADASDEQTEAERATSVAARNSATLVIAANLDIATRGLMTYCGFKFTFWLRKSLLNWQLSFRIDEVHQLEREGHL